MSGGLLVTVAIRRMLATLLPASSKPYHSYLSSVRVIFGQRSRQQCNLTLRHRGEKAVRGKSSLLNGFNLIWVVQLSTQKYTSSLSPQISGYFRAVPPRQEGRIAVVTNARRDAVDARRRRGRWLQGGATRERLTSRRTYDADAYGKTVWFWHPWLMSSCRWRS